MGKRADDIDESNNGARMAAARAMPGDGNEDAESHATPVEGDEIAADRAAIEETRAEMSETIDAIQDTLSPEHLKEQVKRSAKQAILGKAAELASTARRTGVAAAHSAVNAARVAGGRSTSMVRQQPLRLAAFGVGLVGLALGARLIRSHGQQATIELTLTPEPTASPDIGIQSALGRVLASIKSAVLSMQDRVARRNDEQSEQEEPSRPSIGRYLLRTRVTVNELLAGAGIAAALAFLRRMRGSTK